MRALLQQINSLFRQEDIRINHFAVGQSIDDHTQGTQTLIDLFRFFKRLAGWACLDNILAARKIKNV